MLDACQRTLKISKTLNPKPWQQIPRRPDSILLGAPFRVPFSRSCTQGSIYTAIMEGRAPKDHPNNGFGGPNSTIVGFRV